MRFCNGIPNDRYRIVADENRWPAGSASPFRDGRGVQRLPSRCCGARLAALPFPLAPFRSYTGSGRGDVGGWRESLLARARNGRRCTVRASCNIRVFDQVLILVKQNGGSARGQHSLLWFTDAPAWVRGPLARRCGEWLEPIGKRSAP
jgi:hypothetical protein